MVRHIPPRVLGSAVGGVIILTNIRTQLKSDWIDASDGVRHTFYAAIYLVWAAALIYSVHQCRANRDEERRIIAEAEAVAAGEESGSPARSSSKSWSNSSELIVPSCTAAACSAPRTPAPPCASTSA